MTHVSFLTTYKTASFLYPNEGFAAASPTELFSEFLVGMEI